MLSELNLCGICCLLPASSPTAPGQCVGADIAAKERFDQKKSLPLSWPDADFHGPNISVRLCDQLPCNVTYLRAWPPGSVCVTRNMVGICSPRGICKLDYIAPRSNVYPDIMNIRLMGRKKASPVLNLTSVTLIMSLLSFGLIQ